VANGYEARAALRLHEKLLKVDRGFRLPFLSSHPSGDERIQNLKKLIEAKSSQLRPEAAQTRKTESSIQP
jgi:predicted Zn-dependent protease